VLSYLNRSHMAFGRSWLTAPCNSAHQARRLVEGLTTLQSQHELPLGLPQSLRDHDRRGPTRIGFSSEHAVGLAITPHAEVARAHHRSVDRRAILGRIPFRPERVAKLFQRVQHEKLRPSAVLLDTNAVAGQVVRVEAVLDGELPTVLGVAGRLARTERWT